jgi:hypothetical protein
MVGDGQYTAGQIVVFRPQVQERLLRGTAYFPRKSGEWSHASAVLANLDGAIRGEFFEASLQLGGEVHTEEYKENN